MAQGRIPLSFWDWLSLGRQGTPYEILESVQPVVEVPSIQAPVVIQPYSSTTALVAGTAVVDLPVPAIDAHRLWLHLFFNRTNVAATDQTLLVRGIQLAQSLVVQHNNDSGVMLANRFYPLVGGFGHLGALFVDPVFGEIPRRLMATPQSPLSVRAAAAAAVGNLNLSGSYIDLPQSAPFDLNWL